MKTAVVFYSLDGNCAFVAEELKNLLGADLFQIKTKDEKQRSFIGKMFWGAGMVLMKKKPPLKPYNFDPAAYDFIIIGAPVWAGAPAPPIETFLSGAGLLSGLAGKKIALFICHGEGPGKAMEKFKALLPGCTIAAEADFANPSKSSGEAKKKIGEWVVG
ncbi:MAG: flavodoxin [Treponema sp.]|nr:flavodoxin [Treponema sp.]